MNAAEITDKLGLHSLRQRAWVRPFLGALSTITDAFLSTFNPLAPPLVKDCTRVSSG